MVFPLVDADGDVNMYAIPDDDDVEELSLPKNQKYRTLESTRIYRIQQSMTNAVELSDRGTSQYRAAAAQTQTSGHWNSLTGELENLRLDPDAANEVTHLEIPLDKFYDAVFPIWPFDGLTEAVEKLVKSEEYVRSLKICQAGMKDTALPRPSPQPTLGSEDDPEGEFLNLFHMLAECYLDNPLNKPAYNLRVRSRDEVDSSEDNAEKESRLRMPTFAAFCEDTDPNSPTTWNHFAFFIDAFTTEYERALLGLPDRTPSEDPSTPQPPSRETSGAPSRPPDPPRELARCAEEALSYQGNRRYVLGLSLEGVRVRLWYFDRAGTIRSPQHSLKDPLMAKTIVRLFFADQHELGKEVYFYPPPPKDGRRKHPSPFEDVVGSTIEVQGSFFRISSVLHIAHELFGRGTAVYAADLDASREEEHEVGVPNQVVVKLAWQPASSSDESALFRLAHEKGVQGLATLYRSCTKARLDSRVRDRLGLGPRDYQDRELRAQVIGPICIPLYRVQNLETFKKAFISLVRAHRDLYELSGILHHDVSVNNLMVDATDNSVGVLIDLDIAVRIKDDSGPIAYGPVHAGTLPFRSVHVLEQGDPIHELFYRDDLESFYYTLVWMLTYYDFPFASRGPELDSWCSLDLGPHASQKIGYLVENTPKRPSGPLQSTWLHELRQLFASGYRHLGGRDVRVSALDTVDGIVTFERFMKILES